MYIYIHIYIYTCVYINIHVYTHTYIHTQVCMYVCLFCLFMIFIHVIIVDMSSSLKESDRDLATRCVAAFLFQMPPVSVHPLPAEPQPPVDSQTCHSCGMMRGIGGPNYLSH